MKTLFYKSILMLLITFSLPVFSQETEIVKLLNENLKQDLKINPEYRHFEDTLKIIKPYNITDGILSVEIESRNGNSHYIEKQEVPLSKIISLGKDINVILETEGDEDVTITTTEFENGKTTEPKTRKSYLFFTGIREQKHNESFGYNLQGAFWKAGYRIELGSWYD